MLLEEGEEAAPAVLGGLLPVDLRPVIREEGVRRVWVEDELRRRIVLLELGLEALHVLGRNAGIGGAVEPEHRRLDAIHETEGVDAGRVLVHALDLAVPRRRRGHARILRGEVQGESAAAAEAGDAETIRARPRLRLGVIGRSANVTEVLRARDGARDLAHLGEVLALHAALARVELR